MPQLAIQNPQPVRPVVMPAMLVPPVATAPETPKKTTWWEEEGWIEEPSPALRKLVMEGIAAHKRGEGHVYTTMEDLEARLGLCSK